MLDIELVKIQYEILNISLETLADSLTIPLTILQSEAKRHNWRQWWPSEEPLQLSEQITPSGQAILEDPAEILETQSERYLSSAKKRLAVYSLAKEILLAKKYTEFEASLLTTAIDVLDNINASSTITSDNIAAIKSMADIYRNLTAKSYATALQTMSLSADENGLPMVIVRDLSGGASRS